jgi:hypothetical protein
MMESRGADVVKETIRGGRVVASVATGGAMRGGPWLLAIAVELAAGCATVRGGGAAAAGRPTARLLAAACAAACAAVIAPGASARAVAARLGAVEEAAGGDERVDFRTDDPLLAGGHVARSAVEGVDFPARRLRPDGAPLRPGEAAYVVHLEPRPPGGLTLRQLQRAVRLPAYQYDDLEERAVLVVRPSPGAPRCGVMVWVEPGARDVREGKVTRIEVHRAFLPEVPPGPMVPLVVDEEEAPPPLP